MTQPTAGPEGPAVFSLVVPAEAAGERLDRVVAGALVDLSRARLQALIAQGKVAVDGQVAKASSRLKAGQRVTVEVPPAEPAMALAEDLPVAIVYQDADLLVVDKPAGMATHPAPGTARGTLVNALLAKVHDLSGIGGELRPGIVHRLDKDTSGLLVVAKHDRAHRALQAQIQARTAERRYQALVWGRLAQHQGVVDAPIARHPKDRIKMAVVAGGRHARTHYRVIEEFKDASLLELKLETGRTHQIRVHMAHIGHPVIGDPVYGKEPGPMRLSGQLLHAWHLSVDQPTTGERLTFEAPLPPEFERALAFIRRRGYWRG